MSQATRKTGGYRVLSLVGSEVLLRQFRKFVDGIYPEARAQPRPHVASPGTWQINFTGNPAFAVIKELYDGCRIALPRKHAKAQEIISTWRPQRFPRRRRTLQQMKEALLSAGGDRDIAAAAVGLKPESFSAILAKLQKAAQAI